MMISQFSEFSIYLQDKPPLRLAVVESNGPAVYEAIRIASQAGWIRPILISSTEPEANKKFPEDQFKYFAQPDFRQAAQFGAALLQRGEADLLMKGEIPTAEFLHPILDKDKRLLEPGGILSHVAAFSIPGRKRLVLLSDSAINIAPDLAVKVMILKNALQVARLIGYEPPKVAVLSALEKVNHKIPSTVDAAELKKLGDQGDFGKILISGPLALDNALFCEAAVTKGLNDDPVAGQADLLIVPELVSGNILYKSISFIAGYPVGGVVVGAKMPLILTSRADRPEVKLNSIALACFLKHRAQELNSL